MTAVVADASAIVSAIAGGPHRGAQAREALRRGAALHVPYLADVEVTEALRGLARGGKLALAPADTALRRYAALRLRRHPHRALLPRVWELRNSLTAYDAVYVALAEILGAPLLTEDAAVAAASGVRCPVELLRP